MKEIEEIFKKSLKENGVSEAKISKILGISIPTIAKAIDYALKNSEKGDWLLMFKIKTIFPPFEIEQYRQKQPAPKTSKNNSTTSLVHTPEKEIEFKKAVGNQLKLLRKAQGIYGDEIAELIGTDKNNYSAIETGRTHLNCYRMRLIAERLNVSYQTILDGKDSPTDPKSLEKHLIQKDKIISELKEKVQLLEKNAELYKTLVDAIKK